MSETSKQSLAEVIELRPKRVTHQILRLSRENGEMLEIPVETARAVAAGSLAIDELPDIFVRHALADWLEWTLEEGE